MALQRIPYEILNQILSYLSKEDLVKISTVSQHIHVVSEPMIYRSINLWTDRYDSSRLTLLLQTLLTPGRTILASHVRSLSWSHMEYVFSTLPSSVKEAQPASTIIPLTDAALRLGIDYPPTSELPQFILLLHLLPCLHFLTVYPPNARNIIDDFMEGLSPLQPVTTLPLGLQSLRKLHWGAIGQNRGVNPKLLLTIMGLPYIRTIDANVYNDIASHLPSTTAATTPSSTLTHLILPPTDLSSSSLTCILKTPLALTHFTYFSSEFTELQLLPIRIALMPLRNSLQYLFLDFGSARVNWHTQPLANNIGSLRQWPVLRTVRCSLMALLGEGRQTTTPPLLADILPVGIQDFEILSDSYWSVARAVHEVVVLLGQKEAMVHDLKKITVRLHEWKSPDVLGKLKAACAAAGVDLAKGHARSTGFSSHNF